MTDEELVEQIQQGINVQENMAALYKSCYHYIRKIIYPYSKCFGSSNVFEMDDLMNESYFSLCKAVEKYDIQQGKFVTFLSTFLKLDMKRFVESKLPLVHLSVEQNNLLWRYNNILKRNEKEMSDEQVAKELGINIYQLSKLKKLQSVTKTLSLDMQNSDDSDDNEGSLLDKIYCGETLECNVIQNLASKKLMTIWNEVRRLCSDKECMVLEQHYIKNESFNEISKHMGKCAEIARRHHVKALEKLKNDCEVQNIAAIFFDDYDSGEAFKYGLQRFKDTRTSSTELIALRHLEVECWLSEEGLQKIKNWKMLGCNKQQIAARIGIHRVTLSRWCEQYPSINNIINGKVTSKTQNSLET